MAALCLYLSAVAGQSPQFRSYNTATDVLGPLTSMPTNAIADDFGPRAYESKKNKAHFHAGVDFNCSPAAGNAQKWYFAVSPQAGIIANHNKLTHGISKYKYGLVNVKDDEGNGSHTWLFGHVFDDTAMEYDKFNHSIVLKMCEYPNTDMWGLHINVRNSQGQMMVYTYGQVAGAKLVVGNDTLTTTNVVNTTDPFIPIGDSGGDYTAHLHLNTVPYNTSQTGNTINGDPCQFLDIDRPTYTSTLASPKNDSNMVIIYPGDHTSKVRVRMRMEGEALQVKRYNHLMDLDMVELEIKKTSETQFRRINGDESEAIISEGGRLGEPEINHKNVVDKTSWRYNGVHTNAYNDADRTPGTVNDPQPWDDYYFIDFKTRIHKDDKHNGEYKDAKDNNEARYPDGNYNFRVKSTTSGNWYQYTSPRLIPIHNFPPVVEKVRVNKKLGTTGPIPVGSAGPVYYADTHTTYPDPSPTGNAYVHYKKGIKEGCWSSGYDMVVEATASEPLQSLSCKITPLSPTAYTMSSADGVHWTLTIPSPLVTTGTYSLEFTGSDVADCPLLNIEKWETTGYEDKTFRMPLRIQESGPDMWSPNPSLTVFGKDTYHRFTITEGCEGPVALAGEEGSRGGKVSCPQCYDYEQFQVIQTKVPGSQGRVTNVSFTFPGSVRDLTAIWKNSSGAVVGTGQQNVLEPGEYCIQISYNGCCSVNKYFTVKGCEPLIDDIIIGCEKVPENIFNPVALKLKDGAEYQTIKWEPNWPLYYGDELNTGIISGTAPNKVTVTDAGGCTESREFYFIDGNIIFSPNSNDGMDVDIDVCSGGEYTLSRIELDLHDYMYKNGQAVDGWSWSVSVDGEEAIGEENQTTYYADIVNNSEVTIYVTTPEGCTYYKTYTDFIVSDYSSTINSIVATASYCEQDGEIKFVNLSFPANMYHNGTPQGQWSWYLEADGVPVGQPDQTNYALNAPSGSVFLIVENGSGCRFELLIDNLIPINNTTSVYYQHPGSCQSKNGVLKLSGDANITDIRVTHNGVTTHGLVIDRNDLEVGTYFIEFVQQYGCVKTMTIELKCCTGDSDTNPGDNITFKVDAYNQGESLPAMGSIDVTVSGGWLTWWQKPDGSFVYTEDLVNVPVGNYILYIKNECVTTVWTIPLQDCTLVPLDFTPTNVGYTCPIFNEGSIHLEYTKPPNSYYADNSLIYEWSNGYTTRHINFLPGGTYTVTITDPIYGCINSKTFLVNTLSMTVDDNCVGHCNGSELPFPLEPYYNQNNCTIDWYCSYNGQYVNTTPNNLDLIVDYQACAIKEYCNGQLQNTVPGVIDPQVKVADFLLVEDISCLAGFMADACEFPAGYEDYDYYFNAVNKHTYNSVPTPPGWDCEDHPGACLFSHYYDLEEPPFFQQCGKCDQPFIPDCFDLLEDLYPGIFTFVPSDTAVSGIDGVHVIHKKVMDKTAQYLPDAENPDSEVIAIFPNLVKDHIKIKFNAKFEDNLVVEIYDINTNRVSEHRIKNNEIGQELVLNLNGLNSGLFTIKIIYNNKILTTKKVIKI